MNNRLSDRLRPDVEIASWGLEEIKKLENNLNEQIDLNDGLLLINEALRLDLAEAREQHQILYEQTGATIYETRKQRDMLADAIEFSLLRSLAAGESEIRLRSALAAGKEEAMSEALHELQTSIEAHLSKIEKILNPNPQT